MFAWLKRRRIAALEEQLNVVNAAIQAEERIMGMSGRVYPTILVLNAKEKARIEHQLVMLRKPDKR